MTLAEQIAEHILQSIVDGRFVPGDSLPPEAQLASEHGASRLTVREAVQILRTQKVVHIDRGRGTVVDPASQWASLSAVMRASVHAAGNEAEVAARLLEARRLIEVGAAELAARRRSEEDLAVLETTVERMEHAIENDDVAAVAAADLDFHRGILVASGNPFVPMLFDSFADVLLAGRRRTSAVPGVRMRALGHHRAVLRALHAGDAEAARSAMEAHLDPTEDDLRALLCVIGG